MPSTTATVSNLVWDKSPADVRTINQQNLAAMGVGADTIRAFVTNRWFTPTLSVPFVEHLAQDGPVDARFVNQDGARRRSGDEVFETPPRWVVLNDHRISGHRDG